MKNYIKPFLTLAAFVILLATSAQAESVEKMVIALKTDTFELTETDISTLAIGEAKTIETDNGKVIDILRTADGAEIYVDGELLEMNIDDGSLHEEHMVRKHVEVICDDGEECDKDVFILAGDDSDVLNWVKEDSENIFIHKDIELSCTDEEAGTRCNEKMVWISDGADIDLEEIREMHQSGEGHKVIVIKQGIVTED